MEVEPLALPEVQLIRPRVFRDSRGHFVETFSAHRYADVGIRDPFVQDNVSVSARGVVRALHAQHPNGQGKLITVLRGRVYDVAVDVRVGSPRFGAWVGVELDDVAMHQLYIPPGFLHGFVALDDHTVFSYKCTALYVPSAELCVRWNDPAIGIVWPQLPYILAPRDAAAPLLAEVPRERLPLFESPQVPR
jgi:dTDP-4-dehydrorhamnose 3,5-epimerase